MPVADRVSGNDTLLDIGKARTCSATTRKFSWRELY